MTRQISAVFMAAMLAATPAFADTVCVQGNGQSGVRPWRVQATGGGSGSTTSSVNTYAPASTSTTITTNATPCTTAGGASCTTILAAIDLGAWSNVTISIRNSGANAIDNVILQWSPDNSNWEAWDTTTFASLASAAIKSLAISGNSRRYLRIQARSASGSSSVVHLTVNDG